MGCRTRCRAGAGGQREPGVGKVVNKDRAVGAWCGSLAGAAGAGFGVPPSGQQGLDDDSRRADKFSQSLQAPIAWIPLPTRLSSSRSTAYRFARCQSVLVVGEYHQRRRSVTRVSVCECVCVCVCVCVSGAESVPLSLVRPTLLSDGHGPPYCHCQAIALSPRAPTAAGRSGLAGLARNRVAEQLT